MKRALPLGLCLAFGAVGYGLAQLHVDETYVERSGATRQGNLFAGSRNPIGGESVSATEFDAALEGCGVCTLPATGPGGESRPIGYWIRSDGKAAAEYSDGFRVYLTPDVRSNEEYIADSGSILEESKEAWSMVALRGTKVLGRERSETAPAAVVWIEDDYLVQLIGGEEQDLASLVTYAQGLGRVR